MKNVTVTLPEDLAIRARVAAARENKSLSRYIADLLEERCRASDHTRAEDAAALEAFLNGPALPGLGGRWKGREALYAEREDELLHRHDAAHPRGRSGKSGQTGNRGGFAESGRKGRYTGPKRTKPE
jgi:hypothetical protein